MAGLIFVSPGKFTDPSDLPQVPPTPVIPVRGATIDWAADRLPTGALDSWTDMLGARTLDTPPNETQAPVVVGGGTARRLVFDGVNDRIDTTMGITQPCTMILVARSTTGQPGDFIMTGGTGDPWNIGVTQGGLWLFSTGSGSSMFSEQPADTSWHIFIVSVNGGDSAFSVDGTETTRSIDTGAAWGPIRIGATAGSYHGSELRRLAVIPRATTTPERETLRQQLATHYGI